MSTFFGWGTTPIQVILEAFAADKFANEIKVSLNNPSNEKNKTEFNWFKVKSGFVYRNNILYVHKELCQA